MCLLVQAKDTRALLCFDSKEDIEVFADKRLILDGREGEENLLLTVQAWGQVVSVRCCCCFPRSETLRCASGPGHHVADPARHGRRSVLQPAVPQRHFSIGRHVRAAASRNWL